MSRSIDMKCDHNYYLCSEKYNQQSFMKQLFTLLLALIAMTGQAQKQVVWEAPTIEYGTSNGDGFYNLSLDVTKVELKADEVMPCVSPLGYPAKKMSLRETISLKMVTVSVERRMAVKS